MSERFPFSNDPNAGFAFEGDNSFGWSFDPPLDLVVGDIWERYRLTCSEPLFVQVLGVTLSPDTVNEVLALKDSNTPVLVTRAIHTLLLGLAGKLYDREWAVWSQDRMRASGIREDANFPGDYRSLPSLLSRMAYTVKTSMTVDDRFRIAGIIRKRNDYASWSTNPGTDDQPFIDHRLVNASSSLGNLSLRNLNSVLHPEVVASVPDEWEGVEQNLTILKYWAACRPRQILNEERGRGFGRRVVSFNLIKDKDFSYFVSRTRSGRLIQYYMSTSSDSSESTSSGDQPLSSYELGMIRRDDLDHVIEIPTNNRALEPDDPALPDPQPTEAAYRFPGTGEVPYRRPYYTAFTLNGHQIPILDRITNITNLLKTGVNRLVVEYYGQYAWSDWFLLPAIRVVESNNFRPRPAPDASVSSVQSSSSSLQSSSSSIPDPTSIPSFQSSYSSHNSTGSSSSMSSSSSSMSSSSSSWDSRSSLSFVGTTESESDPGIDPGI